MTNKMFKPNLDYFSTKTKKIEKTFPGVNYYPDTVLIPALLNLENLIFELKQQYKDFENKDNRIELILIKSIYSLTYEKQQLLKAANQIAILEKE